MSNSLSDRLDASDAREEASLADIATSVTAIAAELKGAGTGPVGSTVTQAQVDRSEAIATSLEAAAASLKAMVTGAAPAGAHTAEDTSDTTQNGAARADGSIRNNFSLPNFNPALPETT